MALLELGGKRFPIPGGELILGSDGTSGIALAGPGVLPRHAVLRAQPDGQVVIRKASPEADVMINGVRLGAEPTPLLHGDKVEVGGHELTFIDERRSGNTQFVQVVKPPTPAAAKGPAAAANTGGRVVSLTDGREYLITGASLVFGRDAVCDVVVTGKDVSRRHAEIVQTPKGYLLVDSSTNGTFVNEERVHGQRVLARAEVVRMGDEQFRFYADTTPAPAPPPPPAAPPPGSLATLLVKSGTLKGQRFQVRTPVVNIGRADYNDVVLTDPSVSTSHAKLQRREGVWILVDLDSTNGTYVDEERVTGEAAIAPGTVVRFGDVALAFEPTDDALGVEKGGGTVVLSGLSVPLPSPPSPPTPLAPPPPPPAPPVAPKPAPRPVPKAGASKPQPKRPQAAPAPRGEKKKGKGCGASVIAFLVGGAGLAAIVRWLLA